MSKYLKSCQISTKASTRQHSLSMCMLPFLWYQYFEDFFIVISNLAIWWRAFDIISSFCNNEIHSWVPLNFNYLCESIFKGNNYLESLSKIDFFKSPFQERTLEVLPIMSTLENLIENPDEWEVPNAEERESRSYKSKIQVSGQPYKRVMIIVYDSSR